MADRFTRRAFFGAVGVAGITTAKTLADWPCPPIPCPPVPCPPYPDPYPPNGDPPPPPPPAMRVRQNILSLTTPQLDSLKNGITALKALPDTDRRSWTYQAAIHWTDSGVMDPLFNQCEHGSLHFLTWHRIYLSQFEKILRWASGDNNLNLPYWDWVANPVLPEPFRNPANASNPLYDSTRMANNGAPLPPQLGMDVANAHAELTFPPTPGFGFSPSLEGPHGLVHVLVGGPGGNMSMVSRAARDPIFWQHHGNIDRLWDRWIHQGGGRVNPSSAAFLDQQYTFADETGGTQVIRVGDAITSGQLGYQYDSEPGPTMLMAAAPMVMAKAAHAAHGAKKDEEADKVKSKPLRFEIERVKPTVPEAARNTLAAPIAPPVAGGPRVVVTVEGLSADEAPAFMYGVYLNLPPGDPAQLAAHDRDLHYVGGIDFFGKTRAERKAGAHAHGGETFDAKLDASRTVARLQQAGRWNPDNMTVTVLPLAPAPPNVPVVKVQADAAASAKKANVTYQRITIRVEK